MNCFNIFNHKTKRRAKPSPQSASTKTSARSMKSSGSADSPRSIVELYNERGHGLRKFSFSELRNATDNFNRSLKIGEGGFGSVYKGKIRPVGGHGDPLVVAIKKLRRNGMQPIGTYGYAAPEYVETGHLKSNSDLWSFGVVLYEILSGRRAVDISLPQSEQKLIEWVKQFPAESKRFRMVMDPRLNNQYSLSAARKVAKLADSCLRKNPEERPPMRRIVDILRQAIRESESDNISKIACPLPEPSTRKVVHVA